MAAGPLTAEPSGRGRASPRLDRAVLKSSLGGVKTDSLRRFRLVLHYDGTAFQGWQLQPHGRTVQGELEAVLARLTGGRTPAVAAGRTDRGVHATGQVAAVDLPPRWTAEDLHRALNALLPPDLWVEKVQEVSSAFHPRFHAQARSYRYQVGLTPLSGSPFHRRWCWPLGRPLDGEALRAGAALLEGERSFRAFAKAGQEERGHRCRVGEARWVPWEEGVAFLITADRFLHHMVRYLVGTLVEIALAKRPLEDLRLLLEDGGGPLRTSPPAPPQGLFLTRVHYPEAYEILD